MSFIVEVASSPDRDELVAEIWWNDQMVAEVRCAGDGRQFVDLYPSPSGTPWSFVVDEWLDAVKEAKYRLG